MSSKGKADGDAGKKAPVGRRLPETASDVADHAFEATERFLQEYRKDIERLKDA